VVLGRTVKDWPRGEGAAGGEYEGWVGGTGCLDLESGRVWILEIVTITRVTG